MPVWLAPVVAGGLGFLGGYVLDQVFGDGDYTPREMAISTGTSMIGGGLLKPIGQTLGRTVKYGKNLADDVYRAGAVTYDEIIAAGYILAPMVSKPARIEIVGGIVAGYVYDIATRQSPDVRSEQNASDVTSGGTSSGKKLDSRFSYKVKNQYDRAKYRDGLRGPCKKGYVLHRATNGVWHCVKK